MKNVFSILALSMISMSLFAQKFTVTVSTDSILFGNYFEVKFTLEDANGGNFNAPTFENFNIISGPNTSTSMSFMNGTMSQSVAYTYYLEPKEIGSYYIQPASIETNETVLETLPLEVLVVPNPDGIRQHPQQRQGSNSLFDDFFGQPPSFNFDADPNDMQDFFNAQPFFNFDFNGQDLEKMLEEMPNFRFEFPTPNQEQHPSIPEQFIPKNDGAEKEKTQPKKKRKTIKI